MKIHTRQKRNYRLATHVSQNHFFHAKKRKRNKTFKSEEDAHIWASESNLKKDEYSLKKVKRNKRFEIVKLKKK